MKDINMGEYCTYDHEGFMLDLVPLYLQAKALFLKKPFVEKKDFGTRKTKFTKKASFFTRKPEVACIISGNYTGIEELIQNLPEGIEGELVYSIIRDRRDDSFDPHIEESVTLEISVTEKYINDTERYVRSFMDRLLHEHIDAFHYIALAVAQSRETRFGISDDKVLCMGGFKNAIRFDAFGMGKLKDYNAEYAFGKALIEYLKTLDKDRKYYLENEKKFAMGVYIERLVTQTQPVLKEW